MANCKHFFSILFLYTSHCLQASDLYVTSLADSGPGTFREALNNLYFYDNIIFDSNLSGTILLQSALPTISTYVSISGPDESAVSIDGNHLFPLLNILETSSIKNLNFVNGVRDAQKGALNIGENKTLTLTNVQVTPSSSEGGEFPIYADHAMLIVNGLYFPTNSIPEIYIEDGALEIQSSNPENFPYILDGLGQVIVTGNTTVATLTTASSDPVDLTVIGDSGTAVFNGVSIEPFFANFTGGTLQGDYTCLYVVNGGQLQPGNTTTFGVNHTTEDWTQTSEGILFIKLDPSGNCDIIHVGQYANISGGLTLVPSSGSYTQGSTYTFFTTGLGFINQNFDNITSTNNLLDFTINYRENAIEIEILSDCNL